MTIEDLLSEEQLLRVPDHPKPDQESQFVFRGLEWPDVNTFIRKASPSVLANSEAVADAIDWIEELLKPEWVAPDLESRLIAATRVIEGRDAFLARYAIDETKIQMIVTRFAIYLVILPSPALTQIGPLASVNTFLTVQSDPEISWTGGPWSILTVHGFTFGYQRGTSLRDWRDSLAYLTDGRAVKFSISKVQPQSEGKPNKSGHGPTEQAESRWFQDLLQPSLADPAL